MNKTTVPIILKTSKPQVQREIVPIINLKKIIKQRIAQVNKVTENHRTKICLMHETVKIMKCIVLHCQAARTRHTTKNYLLHETDRMINQNRKQIHNKEISL